MASSTAPTQDSNAIPCSQSPIDGTPQTMLVDEIPTPNDSNQVNCMDESEETLVLGKKRRLTSVKAECSYCKKQLGGDTKNGTRHLHDHLKICPLKNTRDIKQSILMPKKDTGGKFSVGTYTFNEEIVRKDLASMIVLHEYSLSMVEHFGFHRFLSSLQPLFKVVSRNTVKNDIMKIYEFEKTKTMRIIEKNTSKIAITTDTWTTSNQKKGYMAITAHFIDETWKLRSRIIRFIYVPCPHTAEVLCDVLVDCLMDCYIDRKLSTLTLDNCTTNDVMINLILNKLDNQSLWLEGSLLHMRCCAHILNLIVRDGLDVIGDGIENIHSSVAFWVATPKRCEKFEETACLLKVSTYRKLVLDCKTRWNSTYKMLKVAICYKDVFTRLKQREPLYKSAPKEKEWEIARDIRDKLKVFNSVTELFSGTEYPTANLYFPKICEIKMSLKEWLCCGKSIIERMAMRMLDKFEKYWFQINGIMGVATILDPRYKLRLLHFYFPLIYTNGEDAKKKIERIQDICYNLLNEYLLKSKASEVGASYQSSASSLPSPDESETDHMSKYDKFVASDFKGGRFISPHRSRLHHDTLEALMCSQDWLWNEAKEIDATLSECYTTFHDDVDDETNEDILDTDTYHEEL
ncbi:hypothetical protein ACS0TY_002790 [Phlomoides rotata]